MPCRLPRILPSLTILALLCILFPNSALAQEEDDSPLVTRAKALMQGLDQLQTGEDRIERRAQLRAMADSLAMDDELVVATHALERAAMMSYQLGDYPEMELDAARGIEVARQSEDRKRLASLMNVQAIAVSVTGDDARAVQLQQELIVLRQELGDRRGEGGSWHNLAYSYLALFQTPEAVDALREALRCHQETGNAYGIAISMASLSNALFDLGRIREGMAMADSAVIAGDAQGSPLVVGSNLNSRGHKRNWLGYPETAMEDFDRAWELLDTAGIRQVAATGAINRAEALVGLGRCEEAIESLDEVAEDLHEIGSAAAQLYADAVRGRALLDCDRLDEAEIALRAAILGLEAFQGEQADESSRAESFRAAGTAFADLAVLHLERGELDAAWEVVERGSAALLREDLDQGDEVTSLAVFQEYLAKVNGAALQFSAAAADRVLAFWITPTELRSTTIQIPEGFRLSLSATLRLLSSVASDEELAPALQRMAEILLLPLPESLDGIQRLVVIPGAFTGFPLEILPTRDGGELGEAIAVGYAPSASILMGLNARTPGDGELLAFADPSPGAIGIEGTRFPTRAASLAAIPLPEAREEARAIAHGEGEVLVGADATPSALSRKAPHAAVLHLATHSLIDPTHPEASALLMAGGDEGMVTARAIAEMSLDCDLASLSGCSTAGGYVVAGEGTLGLTRSFLKAGARTVVATRWDVEDAAARRFMEAFYAALRDGYPRDHAMQQARAELASEGAGHRERSAFMLVGVAAEPVTALQSRSPWDGLSSLLWIAGIFTVLLLVVVFRRR